MPRPAELSIRAIAFGLAVGILLAAANVYVGLKLGFIDAGTTTIILPASVSVSLALGAIGFAVVARVAPGWFERIGPAFASGLIVGEGLAGVATAAVTVARTAS